MQSFDINYSQTLPSGRANAVRVPENVQLGYEAIGRGVSQLGGSLSETGELIVQMESEAEYSKLKRKIDDIENSAFNTLMTTQDPEERQKIYAKAKSDADSVQGTYGITNRKLSEYKNSVLPNWDSKFNGVDFSMRQRRAKAELDLSAQTALEKGNLAEYHRIIDNSATLGLMTPEEQKYAKDHSENASVFAQARLLADKKPAVVMKALDAMVGLNGEEMDMKDKLYRISKQNQELNTDGAIRDAVVTMDKNKEKTIQEKIPLAEQIKQGLVSGGVDGAALRIAYDDVDKWTYGENAPKHPVAYSQYQSRATDIWRGNITKKEFDKELIEAVKAGEISYEEYGKLIQEGNVELKQGQAQMLNQIEQEAGKILVEMGSETGFAAFMQSQATPAEKKSAMSKRQSQFQNAANFNNAVRSLVAQNPDMPPSELWKNAQGMMPAFLSDTVVTTPEFLVEEIENDIPEYDDPVKAKAELPAGAKFRIKGTNQIRIMN